MPTPFPHLTGPFYVYLYGWEGGAGLTAIYAGRGRSRRARAQFRLGRPGRLSHRYLSPKTHNPGLNDALRAIRTSGREAGIVGHDCWNSLDRAKRLERQLIRQHGRRDLGRGTPGPRLFGSIVRLADRQTLRPPLPVAHENRWDMVRGS